MYTWLKWHEIDTSLILKCKDVKAALYDQWFICYE